MTLNSSTSWIHHCRVLTSVGKIAPSQADQLISFLPFCAEVWENVRAQGAEGTKGGRHTVGRLVQDPEHKHENRNESLLVLACLNFIKVT